MRRSERSVTIASFYGRHARLYDVLATLPGIDRFRARAAEALRVDRGDTVVEMGCGTGANLPYLRDRVGAEGRVIGLDLTGPLLARARARIRRRGWSNVALVRGDARCPAVGDIDAILGTFVLGLFEHPAAVIKDWCETVGPGGRIVVLEATRSERLAGHILNPVFDWAVRAGAPTGRAGASLTLSSRIGAAHMALAERTIEYDSRSYALGYLDLIAGTVRDS